MTAGSGRRSEYRGHLIHCSRDLCTIISESLQTFTALHGAADLQCSHLISIHVRSIHNFSRPIVHDVLLLQAGDSVHGPAGQAAARQGGAPHGEAEQLRAQAPNGGFHE